MLTETLERLQHTIEATTQMEIEPILEPLEDQQPQLRLQEIQRQDPLLQQQEEAQARFTEILATAPTQVALTEIHPQEILVTHQVQPQDLVALLQDHQVGVREVLEGEDHQAVLVVEEEDAKSYLFQKNNYQYEKVKSTIHRNTIYVYRLCSRHK